MAERESEQRLFDEINTLAATLQGQRLHPLENRQAQWQVVTKLEQDLAACWTQVRAGRARPSPEERDGRRLLHSRNWTG